MLWPLLAEEIVKKCVEDVALNMDGAMDEQVTRLIKTETGLDVVPEAVGREGGEGDNM